jgi:hypothetical protein
LRDQSLSRKLINGDNGDNGEKRKKMEKTKEIYDTAYSTTTERTEDLIDVSLRCIV